MAFDRLRAGLSEILKESVPSGWSAVRLGGVATTVVGGRRGFTKENDYKSAGYPAFSAAGQDGFVSEWEFDKSAVVIPSIGSIGKAYLAEGHWSTLANTQVIFPNGALLDHRLLYHRVNDTGFWPVSGTAQPFIKPSEIPKCWLALPPVSEQRKIAAILDTVDDTIRNTEQTIAKLKQVEQGMLHDQFTRGIDENGELRDPKRHPEQFKDSVLGRIPRGWTSPPLEDLTVAPICYGIVQAGPFVENGPFVLMIRDLKGDFRTSLHRTSHAIDQQYARARTQPSDLLLSIKGTVGRLAVVPDWFFGNISRDMARMRFSDRVSPEFARWYFESPIGQRRLELSVVGTTRAEVSIHVLKRLALPVPNLIEQRTIAATMAASQQTINGEKEVLAKLRLLKSALMDDLLTGRVRTSDLVEASFQ